MISANLAQNRVRLIHGVDLYMRLYGTHCAVWPGDHVNFNSYHFETRLLSHHLKTNLNNAGRSNNFFVI